MSIAATLVFPVCMVWAILSDALTMTIPNRLQGVLAAGFLVAALAAGLPASLLAAHLATAALALVVGFGCFAAGWMGGGDAKLIAATALWLGPAPALADYVVFASLIGGALTLALLLARRLAGPTTGVASLDRLLDPAEGAPYGIALGAAGLLAFLEGPAGIALS